MRGSDILATLPSSGASLLPGIWKAIQAGYYIQPAFQPLVLSSGGHTVKVWVATDALQLGEVGDSFRPMASALLAQRVADHLGLYLPTAKIVRAAYQDAQATGILVAPKTQPASSADRITQGYSPSMNDRDAMVRHSWEVSKAVQYAPGGANATGGTPRIYSSGKNWVVDKKLASKPGAGCNHGWYTSSAPYRDAKGVSLWQDRGCAHNAGTDLERDPGHYDYSQTLSELVYPWVQVDERDWRDWAEVLKNPSLAGVVNDDGPLPTARPYVAGGSLPQLPVPTDAPSGPGAMEILLTSIVASVAVVGGVFVLSRLV